MFRDKTAHPHARTHLDKARRLRDPHPWLDRDDILALIRALGFDDIRIAHDEPDHQNGPAFSVFARRG